MKISINWIKEYVNLDNVDINELIKQFGLKTAEIEGVEYKGKGIENVIVAKIIEVNAHPNSNKLHCLKVDTGEKILDVVCGAINVKVNNLVALALVGGKVNGVEIKPSLVAGVLSYGMCCSEFELGISNDNSGIIEVTQDVELGTDIKKVYQIDDIIFEIDNKSLTHRPDLWGHYGIAREISCILDRDLKEVEIEDFESVKNLPKIKLNVKSNDCLRYSTISIDNIERKTTPINLRIRLFYLEQKSINFIADMTNYVMRELGQPMHSFDKRVIDNIMVENLNCEQSFQTLDRVNRVLPSSALVIKNNDEIIGVAGIMGGLNSEIKQDTTSVIIESACFNASRIRKTSISIGLRTEASLRYEKSLDPQLTSQALARYVKLIKTYDKNAEITSAFTDIIMYSYPKIEINTSIDFIEKHCGIEIKTDFAVNILKRLGFIVYEKNGNLKIDVPSYRATKDVSIPEDIVEEVSRNYGYDNILAKPVKADLIPVAQFCEHELSFETKRILAERFKMNETSTYLWQDLNLFSFLNIETPCFIKTSNSEAKENSNIRSEIVPSLLKVIYENQKNYDEMNVFEIARCVTGLDKNQICIEEKHLAIVLCDKNKKTNEKDIYFKLKDIINYLSETLLNVKLEYKLSGINKNFVHPKNNALIIANNEVIGYFGILHPNISKNINVKAKICVLEINFSKFASLKSNDRKAKIISKYQSTVLDFNFICDKTVIFDKINKVLLAFVPKSEELKYNLEFVEVYQDAEVLKDKKSFIFRFEVYSMNRTLKSEDINRFSDELINYANENNFHLRK